MLNEPLLANTASIDTFCVKAQFRKEVALRYPQIEKSGFAMLFAK
jgi:hypothetical protein